MFVTESINQGANAAFVIYSPISPRKRTDPFLNICDILKSVGLFSEPYLSAITHAFKADPKKTHEIIIFLKQSALLNKKTLLLIWKYPALGDLSHIIKALYNTGLLSYNNLRIIVNNKASAHLIRAIKFLSEYKNLNQNTLNALAYRTDLHEILETFDFFEESSILTRELSHNILEFENPRTVIIKMKEIASSTVALIGQLRNITTYQPIDNLSYDDYYNYILTPLIRKTTPTDIQKTLAKIISTEKRIELLLISDNIIDKNLIDVIKARESVCEQKGNILISLPYIAYKAMMDIPSNPTIPNVNKLSFLHHHSEIHKNAPYMHDDIGTYVSRMPNLTHIVLRGCATAAYDSKAPTHCAYKIKHLPEGGIHSRQVKKNTILLQQTEINKATNTTLKYIHPETGKQHIHGDIMDIPLVKDEISREIQARVITYCGVTQEPEKTLTYRERDLIQQFFDETAPMTKSDRAIVRQFELRASTQEIKKFGKSPSLLEAMTKRLMAAGCSPNITIKGYIGPYSAGPDRMVPWVKRHSQRTTPKALSISLASLYTADTDSTEEDIKPTKSRI